MSHYVKALCGLCQIMLTMEENMHMKIETN